jgi:hypothetical protein
MKSPAIGSDQEIRRSGDQEIRRPGDQEIRKSRNQEEIRVS